MTTAKSTKKALVASVLSLLLCMTMLLGTTFAWFTDNASTAVNKIQSGTLDVVLLDASGNNLEGATLDFIKAAGHENEPVLWEPGCTYNLPEVYVQNNGTLALKYKIIISGIQGDAKLNEAIDWTIGGLAMETEYTLVPGQKSDALTISGTMKTDAGNEYQGLSIDGIAITVVATQATVEHDSIDNQYDKNAQYIETVIIPDTTAVDQNSVNTAMANGGNVLINAEANTVTLGNNSNIGDNTGIDLNGTSQKIVDSIKAQSGQSLTMVDGTLVKDGTFGKIRFDTAQGANQKGLFDGVTFTNTRAATHTGSSSNATDSMIQIVPKEGNGTYIFKNCVFNNASVEINGLSGVEPGNINVVFENCTFNNWGNTHAIDIKSYAKGSVTITGCTFNMETTSNVKAVSKSNGQVTATISDSTVNGTKVEASGDIKVFSSQSVKLGDVTAATNITYKGIATEE